jgi:hypothetical protein
VHDWWSWVWILIHVLSGPRTFSFTDSWRARTGTAALRVGFARSRMWVASLNSAAACLLWHRGSSCCLEAVALCVFVLVVGGRRAGGVERRDCGCGAEWQSADGVSLVRPRAFRLVSFSQEQKHLAETARRVRCAPCPLDCLRRIRAENVRSARPGKANINPHQGRRRKRNARSLARCLSSWPTARGPSSLKRLARWEYTSG